MTGKMIGFLAAAAMLVGAAGCVYVSEKRGGPAASESVRAGQLASLEMGMTYQTVLERLGPPLASEARKVNGSECRYLVYPTRAGRDDGSERRGEARLVFQDKVLIGWGAPGPACPQPEPEG